MVGELDVLSEWIPEQMAPGTVFVLENAGETAKRKIHTGPCSPVPPAAHWASSRAGRLTGWCL